VSVTCDKRTCLLQNHSSIPGRISYRIHVWCAVATYIFQRQVPCRAREGGNSRRENLDRAACDTQTLRTKEAAMRSTPWRTPNMRSSLSFSVMAGRSHLVPGKLMPCRRARRGVSPYHRHTSPLIYNSRRVHKQDKEGKAWVGHHHLIMNSRTHLGLAEHGCVVDTANDVVAIAGKNSQGNQAVVNADLLAGRHDLWARIKG
jgi:hypothetical protein